MAFDYAINLMLAGRRKIFTSADVIDESNIINEVNQALSVHLLNLYEMEYLYWYRRGVQPVLSRTKKVRPEICNKVVVNTANSICVFKNGFLFQNPLFYSSRKENDLTAKKVSKLNEYLYLSGKQEADNEVVNWFHTVGLGAIYVEPDLEVGAKVYSLDPRSAFVVYSQRPGNKPMLGVNVVNANGTVYVDAYTQDKVFRMVGGATGNRVVADIELPEICTVASLLERPKVNAIGEIPIIEYQYNENRMAAFEPALSLLDAYNETESNRQDGIAQFIQSLVVAVNCEIPEGEDANSIRESGMIVLKSTGENKAEFKILSEQLDQSQTQVTLDNLYEQILEKCGVPSSVRDSASTSDNVGAVYLRNGWAIADTDARNTEDLFRKSNKLFDKVFIKVLSKTKKLDIKESDYELKFPRNDQNNVIAKTQAALNMKALGFSPELAFLKSGLSNDPLGDVAQSKKYIDKVWLPESNNEAADVRTVRGATDEVKNPWDLDNDKGGEDDAPVAD